MGPRGERVHFSNPNLKVGPRGVEPRNTRCKRVSLPLA